MKAIHCTALVLVIIGAINWGLIGFFQFDLVAALFGGQSAALSRVVYSLVGLSGLVVAATALTLYSNMRIPDYSHRRTSLPSR